MLWADDNENEGLKDSIMWNKSSIQGAYVGERNSIRLVLFSQIGFSCDRNT